VAKRRVQLIDAEREAPADAIEVLLVKARIPHEIEIQPPPGVVTSLEEMA
jgi:hypothetical protein